MPGRMSRRHRSQRPNRETSAASFRSLGIAIAPAMTLNRMYHCVPSSISRSELSLCIVVEQFGVASPLNRRVHLPRGLLTAEVLIQDVVKKLIRQSVVGLGAQGLLDLT